METVFLERSERLTLTLRKGTPDARWERTLEGLLERRTGADSQHQWHPAPLEGTGLPAVLVEAATRLAERPEARSAFAQGFPALGDALQARALELGAARLELTLRDGRRTVGPFPGSEPWETQHTVQLEVRATVATAQATVELAGDAVSALVADPTLQRRTLEELVARARGKSSAEAVPTDAGHVVIPPGADAGVLWHELCGHPLEGDVVARRASFLAVRQGQGVAAEKVTVVDDPTGPAGQVRYARDDEGTPSARVALLEAGRVAGALCDLRSAETLGMAPNGHGRRALPRRFALPRMSHTELQGGPDGTFEEILAETPQGLLVPFLTPVQIDLASGDFVFLAPECRRIEGGRLGAWVRPLLLSGNALRTLSAIDRVGRDRATFFGLKGCGKLDQGGLPVSFGNPTVRFTGVQVRPAP